MTDPTPPLEPLEIEAVKLNLRVSGTAEDDLIDDLIVDAREFVERETGLVLVPRTVTETVQQLGRWIDLSSWPVTAVSAVRYPLNGVLTDLAPGSWLFSPKKRPVRLLPASYGWGVAAAPCGWPTLPVEIDVQAGYEDPAAVPRAATRAMHMLIAHWYENRQTSEVGVRAAAIEVPFGATKLIQQMQLTRV